MNIAPGPRLGAEGLTLRLPFCFCFRFLSAHFFVFLNFCRFLFIGFLFLFVMIWAAWLWKKKKLFDTEFFLKLLVLVQPLGFVAVITGWVTAEVGRQPWVVYGVMRTAHGVSPITAGSVLWSFILIAAIYAIIGISYFYYVIKTLSQGPDLESPLPALDMAAQTEAPFSALKG